MRTLKVVDQRLDTLKPFPHNARTHSKKQIRQIADSIKTFGWTNPVLVDGDGGIIAGHGRVEAAKLLGMESVPTLLIDHLTDEQKRAYILADNRLAELAGWDVDILATELQFLTSIDLDFDVSVIGFETAEIDLMIESLDPEDDEAEEVPGIDKNSLPVSRLGDLWLLGPHRLLCGDARDPASYAAVILDDFSRYIIAWKLCTTMKAEDVTATLEMALKASGCDQATVVHKPRLLSDNGSSYIAGDLADWLDDRDMEHVRGAPYHPQTQGKIERWHQTLKNRILLENYYLPGHLEAQIEAFVEHYNHCRYHESLSNLVPADVYFGRGQTILLKRERVKQKTIEHRRLQHRKSAA